MKRFLISVLLAMATAPAFAQAAPTADDLQAALAEANAQISILAYRAETFAAELAKAKRENAALNDQLKAAKPPAKSP
jgi:septal ring factor EnvC (AmiA/AmiB activator)